MFFNLYFQLTLKWSNAQNLTDWKYPCPFVNFAGDKFESMGQQIIPHPNQDNKNYFSSLLCWLCILCTSFQISSHFRCKEDKKEDIVPQIWPEAIQGMLYPSSDELKNCQSDLSPNIIESYLVLSSLGLAIIMENKAILDSPVCEVKWQPRPPHLLEIESC